MILSGVIAALAVAPVQLPHVEAERADLVVEAVRYCVDHLAGSPDGAPPPRGFDSRPPTDALNWRGGPRGREVSIVASENPADEDLQTSCMVIAAGIGSDVKLPAWFAAQGFEAHPGAMFAASAYLRQTETSIIAANWADPADESIYGNTPMLLVYVRRAKPAS